MGQPYLYSSSPMRAAPDPVLRAKRVDAVRGIAFGIAISLPLWALILWPLL